jgi:hypothetical protein
MVRLKREVNFTIKGATQTFNVAASRGLVGGPNFRLKLEAWPDEIPPEFPTGFMAQLTHTGTKFYGRVEGVNGNRVDVYDVKEVSAFPTANFAGDMEALTTAYAKLAGMGEENSVQMEQAESKAILDLLRYIVTGKTDGPALI